MNASVTVQNTIKLKIQQYFLVYFQNHPSESYAISSVHVHRNEHIAVLSEIKESDVL